MSDEIVLYTNPYTRGRVARWMLEEAGVPYRAEILDLDTTAKAPPYLAINPMGKVPAIRHGDTVVTETGAICAYLADAFPEARLAPPLREPARGPYHRWLMFAAGPIEQVIAAGVCGWQTPPERRGMVGFGSLEKAQDTLVHALEGQTYLAGGAFSAADLYVAAEIAFAMQVGVFEKRPAFITYTERMNARPAAIRASGIDNA